MKQEIVENFVAGSNEIDRQREIIKRILTTLESLMHSYIGKTERLILGVGTSPLRIYFNSNRITIYSESYYSLKQRNGVLVEKFLNGLEHQEIPTVYTHLDILIKEAFKASPKIKEHFEFFIQQAPKN
jgi:hypothetical protein